MEKKRVFSKSLILLAITSIMLFAMSIYTLSIEVQQIFLFKGNFFQVAFK